MDTKGAAVVPVAAAFAVVVLVSTGAVHVAVVMIAGLKRDMKSLFLNKCRGQRCGTYPFHWRSAAI